jgi:hypothetical protein
MQAPVQVVPSRQGLLERRCLAGLCSPHMTWRHGTMQAVGAASRQTPQVMPSSEARLRRRLSEGVTRWLVLRKGRRRPSSTVGPGRGSGVSVR